MKYPWSMNQLRCPPAMRPAPGVDSGDGHVTGIFYETLDWRGETTEAFAWVGRPAVEPGQTVPGIVLVHGGGGTAFDKWVRLWVGRGYAAIAMDTCGCVASEGYVGRPRHEHGGPPGWGGFEQLYEPIQDQWMYHAVADVILGHSLLRSLPEVDGAAVGLTGISWGGILTCIVSGLDDRFAFTAPVYGCGALDQADLGKRRVEQIGVEGVERWCALWDPIHFLPQATSPMLWINGTSDRAFQLPSWQVSYRTPSVERTLVTPVGMAHSQDQGAAPAEILHFANSVVSAGRPLCREVDSRQEGADTFGRFMGPGQIRDAQLNYTSDGGPWVNRSWHSTSAFIDPSTREVRGTPPKEATAWFLSIRDDRGLRTAGEHRTREP